MFSETGSLTTFLERWGHRSLCFVCRSTSNLAEALYSYWFDKPWFLTEGNLLRATSSPYTWSSQWVVIHVIKQFLAPLPGSISFSKGSYTLPLYFLCYCPCFVLLVLKIKNPKILEFQLLVFFLFCLVVLFLSC